MISRTNVILAALLAVVVLLTAVSRVDYSRPNVEVLAKTSMKYTPASTTYEPSGVFANGMTQQEPVRGTIPRGELPLHFAPLPPQVDPKKVVLEDAVPGKELTNPMSLKAILQQTQQDELKREIASKKEPTSESQMEPGGAKTRTDESDAAKQKTDDGSKSAVIEETESPDDVAQRRFQASIDRGNDIYLAFCICCHGPKGKGDGMVAQRGYPPPPSFLIGTSNKWNDGQLFYILTNGRANMPQFAAELPRESRWDVINYVRTLQEASAASVSGSQNGTAGAPATKEDARKTPAAENGPRQEPGAKSPDKG